MTDPHSVELGSNSNVVPDGGPLANEDIANERSIGSYPGIVDLGDSVVQRHLLSMSRGFLEIRDVVLQPGSEAVKSYIVRI